MLKDCPSDDFEIILKFCYNPSSALLEDLSVDRVIRVSLLADRYLFTSLQSVILKTLQKKFSTIFALKIYMWALNCCQQREPVLETMHEFIVTNFSQVFFKGVFHQSGLMIDEDVVTRLIAQGSRNAYVKARFRPSCDFTKPRFVRAATLPLVETDMSAATATDPNQASKSKD